MAIRGIDGQIMVHKAPEAAKMQSDQSNRQDVFQRALAEQGKAKAAHDQSQVPTTSEGHEITKDQGQQSGGRKRKALPKGSAAKVSEEEPMEDKTKGVSIDVRI